MNSGLPSVPRNRRIFEYAASLVERELARIRENAVRADAVFNEYNGERNTPGLNPQMAERVFMDVFELAHIHARLLAEARKED